jgi:galactokinase
MFGMIQIVFILNFGIHFLTYYPMDLNILTKDFFEHYGDEQHKPRIFFAPGRVNLIGEHTDYNGGYVLPCALQFGTWLLIRENGGVSVKMASLNQPYRGEVALDNIHSKVSDYWINYPLGIMDQFTQFGIQIPGFDMLFAGDIPNGAGLSSSASIEMVTAFALKEILQADALEMIDLIKLAQRSENQFIGLNCGIMDMFAVGMGAKDHALFLDCHTLEHKRVHIGLKGYKLIIVNSSKSRELADSKYNERVAECQLALSYLNRVEPVSRLGELAFMQFFKIQERIPDELIRKRARHVVSEDQRVLNAVSCLKKGDIHQFGALMNASHESLRDNYEVTGFELDTLVEEALKINGVLGARMTGAGFGGCTVNLVKEDVVDQFIQKIGAEYTRKTGLTPVFYNAEISDGVREIPIQNNQLH